MSRQKGASPKHSRKRLSIRRELGRKVAETGEYGGRRKRHREHGSSKYRPEYAAAMLAYFDQEAFKVRVHLSSGLSSHVFNSWPTFEGFAASIGCIGDTVRRWASEVDEDGELLRPDFSASYARARDMQQDLVMQGGLSGAYPAAFACLEARRVLGWKDRVKVDATAPFQQVNPLVLDLIYAQKMRESADLNATRGR